MTISPPNREVHGIFFHDTDLGSLSQAHTVLRVINELREYGVSLKCCTASTSHDVADKVRDDHHEFILTTVLGSL